MDVKTEKTVVIRLSAEEAGVLLSLLGLVSGPIDALGRSVTDAMYSALKNAGMVAVDAWDFSKTCIEPKAFDSDAYPNNK